MTEFSIMYMLKLMTTSTMQECQWTFIAENVITLRVLRPLIIDNDVATTYNTETTYTVSECVMYMFRKIISRVTHLMIKLLYKVY